MDYEQKYKEALKAAIAAHKDEDRHLKATLERIFPELKESEDVQHRKFILEYLYDGLRKSDEQFKGQFKCAINWLEKQGEKQQKTPIWKHWKDGIAGNGEGKPIYLIKYGHTYSLSSCLCFECNYIKLSELDKLMLEKQEISYTKKDVDDAYVEGMAFAKYELEKQCEQKTDWSEEDENYLNTTIAYLKDANEFKKTAEKCITWLNSLRPQNT